MRILDFSRLYNLQDGWYDGTGKAPSHTGLDWLESYFENFYSKMIQSPYLYPTFLGGVRAEWSLGSLEISLEIDLETHCGFYHCIDLEKSEVFDSYRSLDLDNPKDWTWLVSELNGIWNMEYENHLKF